MAGQCRVRRSFWFRLEQFGRMPASTSAVSALSATSAAATLATAVAAASVAPTHAATVAALTSTTAPSGWDQSRHCADWNRNLFH